MFHALLSLFCPPKLNLGFFTLHGHEYDVGELARTAGPATELALGDLVWLLDEEVWMDHCDRPITPRAVLRSPHQYPYHHDRIFQADLAYPILVYKRQDGGTGVADGCHRLCKAFVLGHLTITARYVVLE